MKFHGFNSIAEYEQACYRTGFVTRRIPCSSSNNPGERFFILETSLEWPTPTSVSTWHLFTADETSEIMDGVVNGCDERRLYDAGFIPL